MISNTTFPLTVTKVKYFIMRMNNDWIEYNLIYACNVNEGLSYGIPYHSWKNLNSDISCFGHSSVTFFAHSNDDQPYRDITSFAINVNYQNRFHFQKSGFALSWNIDEENVIFEMSSKRSGWLGVSLSESNVLPHIGSDMYIGWVDSVGSAFIYDGYSFARGIPLFDHSQDASVLYGKSTEHGVKISWTRKRITNDSFDIQLGILRPLTIGYAFHDSNIGENFGNLPKFKKHTNNGFSVIDISNGKELPTLDPGLCFIFSSVAFFMIFAILHFAISFSKKRSLQEMDESENDNSFYFQYSSEEAVPGILKSKVRIFERLKDFFLGLFNPSFSDRFIFFVWILLNGIFVAFWEIPVGRSKGLVWGYLAAANSLFVVFPATRNSLIHLLFGIGHDRSLKYHKWLGKLVLFESTMHWYFNLHDTFNTEKHLSGFVQYVFLAFLCSTSADFIRKLNYDLSNFLHYSFFGYYLFGSVHSISFMSYTMVALSYYAIDVLLRTFKGGFPSKTASLLVYEPNKAVRVRIFRSSCNPNVSYGYVLLNFPQVSLFEWHPFSVLNSSEDHFEVLIKNLGDFTSKLIEMSSNRSWLYVRCDGPHGNCPDPSEFEHVLLLGGGAGITTLIGYLNHISRLRIPSSLKSIELHWICQHPEESTWLEPDLDQLRDCIDRLMIRVHISASGRPSAERLVEQWNRREGLVFVCGPEGMINEASQGASKIRARFLASV
jgi:predicted ferric reductase